MGVLVDGVEGQGDGGGCAGGLLRGREGRRGQGDLVPGGDEVDAVERAVEVVEVVVDVGGGRVAEERGGIELGLDRVVLDLEQEARSLGDEEPEEGCNDPRDNPDPYNPAPHDVDGAGDVVEALSLADDDDDQRDQVACNLAEGLHEEDGGHHAGPMASGSESTQLVSIQSISISRSYSDVMTALRG